MPLISALLPETQVMLAIPHNGSFEDLTYIEIGVSKLQKPISGILLLGMVIIFIIILI